MLVSAFPSPLYLSLEDLRAHPLGRDRLCKQILLQPSTRFHPMAQDYINRVNLELDDELLYNNLSAAEKTAVFIRIVGFKSYSAVVNTHPETLGNYTQLIEVHKQIKKYKNQFNFFQGNILRIFKFSLYGLILSPKNWTHIKKHNFGSSAQLSHTQKNTRLQAPKDKLIDTLVANITAIFVALEFEAEITDKDRYAQSLKSLEKFIKNMDTYQSAMQPSTKELWQEMAHILQVCLKHPSTSFPLLLMPFKHVEKPEILPVQLIQLLKSLSLIHHYYGKAFQKMLQQSLPSNNQLSVTFGSCLKDDERDLQKLLIALTHLQKQIKYHNVSQFFETVFSSRLVSSLKALEDTSKSSAEKKRSFTASLQSLEKKLKASDYIGYYIAYFLPIDQFTTNIVATTITNVHGTMDTIYTKFHDFKTFSIKELRQFASGSLSLLDLILITVQKEAFNIILTVKQQEEKETKSNQDDPLILVIDRIQDQFCHIYNIIYAKNDFTKYLVLQSIILEKLCSQLHNLTETKSSSIIKMVNLYEQRINQSLSFLETYAPYNELIAMLTHPLASSNTLDLSISEINLIKDLIFIYKEKCIFYFDDIYFSQIEAGFNSLMSKTPEDTILRSQFIFYTNYKKFVTSWVLELQTDWQNMSLPKQVEFLLNHFKKFDDVLIKFAVSSFMKNIPLKNNIFFNLYKGFKKNFSYILTPLTRYKNFNSIINTPTLNSSKKIKSKGPLKTAIPKLEFQPIPPLITSSINLYHVEDSKTDLPKAPSLSSNHIKINTLLDLCYMAPLVSYQVVRHGKLSQTEKKLQSRLDSILPNLANSLKNLMLLVDVIENRPLTPISLPRTHLLLAVCFEQVLKLLLAPLQDPMGKTALLTKNSKNEPAINWHDLSSLYHLLLYCNPTPAFSLSEDQLKCLGSLDSVIGITARYQGAYNDLLSTRISQIQYLSSLEKLSEKSNHTPLAKRWICDLTGSALEKAPLVTYIQKGHEYLQKEQAEFICTNLDTLKMLLSSLDPDQMSTPVKHPLFEVNWVDKLKQLYASPLCENLPPQFNQALALATDELQAIQELKHIYISKISLQFIRSMALNECEYTLDFFSSIPVAEVGHAEACTFLLKESILLEKTFHALLSVLSIYAESGEHLLLTNNKKIIYSHSIQESWKLLLPYIQEDLINKQICIKSVQERLKLLEPLLKQAYRYQGTDHRIQILLNQFQFLDQIRFALKHDMLTDSKLLEETAKLHNKDFSMESLNESAQQLFNQHIILPCTKTLHLTTILLQIMRDKMAEFNKNNKLK